MFPHPHNQNLVRAIEREQLLAQIERERRFALQPLVPFRPSALRRAARMVTSLIG